MTIQRKGRRRGLALSQRNLVLPPRGRIFVEPTTKDVRRGRGGNTNKNEGNQLLLNLVRPREREYAKLKRGQKGRLSEEIVAQIHAMGGRFLEREIDSHGNARFYEMDPGAAVKLVEQKFRDEPNKRKARAKQRKEEESSTIHNLDVSDCKSVASPTVSGLLLDPTRTYMDPNQTSPSVVVEPSPIHCISPAHSIEESENELVFDDDPDCLDEDEVNACEQTIFVAGETKEEADEIEAELLKFTEGICPLEDISIEDLESFAPDFSLDSFSCEEIFPRGLADEFLAIDI